MKTAEKFAALGRGIEYAIEGRALVLRIDLDGDQGPSSSGKSTIVASTGGNQSVAGVKVGVNVYR